MGGGLGNHARGSGFGLVAEGLAASSGTPTLLVAGLGAGVALVIVADAVLERVDLGEPSPRATAANSC